MIKKLTILTGCLVMAGCAGIAKREPTCLEKVSYSVKTQKILADATIAFRGAGIISDGVRKEVSKALDSSVSLTDSAEMFCNAEKEDLALLSIERASDLYIDVCTNLELTDKPYCAVLK